MVISNDHLAATIGGCRTSAPASSRRSVWDILDRIHSRELERVVITKRGIAVALLLPTEAEAAQVERLHGFLRGSLIIPPTVDLTAPIADEPLDADQDEIQFPADALRPI
jgi:antitoxin (DNA-binding transcriptional repressor) of toxin-antitoxin stability system